MSDAYNGTYDAGEVDEVVIDGAMGIGIQFIAFAGLVALVMLYAWFKRKAK